MFNAPSLVDFVKSVSHAELCPVKTRKKDVVIPRGQSVKVRYRVNTSPLSKPTPVLFEADENGQWPSGLKVVDMLATAKGGRRAGLK